MLIKHVTFNGISLLKSTISQQVERLKTNEISEQVAVDTTLSPLVDSVSVGISSDVTPDRDHVTMMDTK